MDGYSVIGSYRWVLLTIISVGTARLLNILFLRILEYFGIRMFKGCTNFYMNIVMNYHLLNIICYWIPVTHGIFYSLFIIVSLVSKINKFSTLNDLLSMLNVST